MMKITNIHKAMDIYRTQSACTKPQKKNNTSLKKDTFSLSSTGREYQIALKALAKTPDIRKEKVDKIKKQLESGTYNVTGKEVADKLVDQFFDQRG